MSITYGDLPSIDICYKLTTVSFSTPKKNVSVYRFVNFLKQFQDAFNNEQNKLLVKLGTPVQDKPGTYFLGDNAEEYSKKIKALEATEIEEKIPIIDLSEDDFEDDDCYYAKEKKLRLNALEIGMILEFIEKLKTESKAD